MVAGNLVEFVSVQKQEATPISKLMHVFADDINAAECKTKEVSQSLIVIARNEDDTFAAPGAEFSAPRYFASRSIPCCTYGP